MHTRIETAIAVVTSNLLSRYHGFNYRYQHSSAHAWTMSKLFTHIYVLHSPSTTILYWTDGSDAQGLKRLMNCGYG